MIKHKRSQSGFGIVEALCFIVMFSMVGLIGWYVINENQNSQETLDNIGGAEVQTSSAKPAAVGEKFIFKELGVQINLPEALKDMTYRAETITSVNGGKTTALYLNSASLGEVFEKCYGEKPDANNPPNFAAISKSDGKYPEDPNMDNVDGSLLKQFDKFFISGSIPNGTTICDQPGVEEGLAHSEITKRSKALGEAFKTATLVE